MGAALLVLAAAAPVSRAAPPPSCTLVPQLRDVTVNQGLGSYTSLARGKEGLLRLFLSLPSCAGSTASIALTGGSLTVSTGGQTLGVVQSPTPAPTSPFPQMPRFDTGAALDAPADPKFVLSPQLLAPPGVSTAFTATFSATITYSAKTSSNATPVNGSITFNTLPGTRTPISAVVERPTNGVRVLAVPLGNAGQPYETQFSPDAQRATVNAMQTLSRLLPVPAGVGDLATQTTPVPGVRYRINPAILDVSSLLDANGLFCGTASNFDAVKAELAQFLQSHNAANPTAPADLAVGVFDAAISKGADQGCAEGMAAVGAPQAWIRAVPDQVGAPSISGGTLTMEFAHTLGLVPAARDNAFSPFHSPNTAADGTAPNRGYNVSLRSFLVDDRTVLTLSGTWNNNTVLFERDDWAFMLCKLGGATSGECPTSGDIGAPAGADPLFVMSGSTDGTPGGTDVVESYFTGAGLPTRPDPASSFRLLQKAGGVTLRDDGVPVIFGTSLHGHDGDTETGLFTVALPFATSATTVQLVDGSGEVLYEVDRNQDDQGQDQPPDVTGVTVVAGGDGEPVNVTNDGAAEDVDPALTDDGSLLAWSDGEIQVMLADDPAVRATVPDSAAGADPAWSSDRTRLAFVQNVDVVPPEGPGTHFHGVYVVDVDPTKAPDEDGFFVESQLAYMNAQPFATVGHPSFEAGPADSARVVFDEYDAGTGRRRLKVMSADFATSTFVTPGTEAASEPSWSHTPGDNRIAYVHEATCSGEFCTIDELWLVDPDAESPAGTPLLTSAGGVAHRSPSWGTDGRIAIERGQTVGDSASRRIALASPAGGTPTLVTDGPSDRDPALAGTRLAFERLLVPQFDDVGAQTDVMLLDLGSARADVSGEAPVGTDPADLRMDLFLSCDGPLHPMAVGVPPSSVDGQTAEFSAPVDSSLSCGDGTPTLTAILTDGLLRSDAADPEASAAFDSEPKPPVAEISSPRVPEADEPDGTPFLEHDSVPLRGLGIDPEGGELTGSSLEWFVDGVSVGNGAQLDLAPLAVGTHTVRLEATDSDGNVAEAGREIVVVADADHDGIPATAETPCASDANASDADADPDGDGIPSRDDWTLTGEPCVASPDRPATANFDPDVLLAGSLGRTVTVHLAFPFTDAGQVNPAGVLLTLPGGDGCAEAAFPVVPGGWSASGRSATAKFDRAAVIAHLRGTCGLTSGVVPIEVDGTALPTSGSWSFTAADSFFFAP